MGDDGIGPFAIKMLESQYNFPAGVELLDLGTPGLDLPIYLSGADALIIIDAAQFEGEPGSVCLFRKQDVRRDAHIIRTDPHSPALHESLCLVELTGEMPSEFLLVGVKGTCFELGSCIATPVRLAMPQIATAVLRELERLCVPYWPAASARQPDIWWEAKSCV